MLPSAHGAPLWRPGGDLTAPVPLQSPFIPADAKIVVGAVAPASPDPIPIVLLPGFEYRMREWRHPDTHESTGCRAAKSAQQGHDEQPTEDRATTLADTASSSEDCQHDADDGPTTVSDIPWSWSLRRSCDHESGLDVTGAIDIIG